MNKIIAIVISILILFGASYPLSQIITKKRVIIIKNSSAAEINEPSSPFLARTLVFPSKKEQINAIFLGIPGQENNAPNLTDTLMVMSIDSESKQGFLLSIPRDLLVKIPGTNYYTKINSIYQTQGIDSIQNVLSEITGLDFNYNVIIDLEGVKKIIDQVEGIDIFVEKEIYDPAFPGPNNSYQLFALQGGWQHLDGETAIKYIRTRHDASGDFARMRRQQKVLTALKEKIYSFHPVWDINTLLDIWQVMTGHFQTNLSIKDIKTFWEISKNIDFEKIKFEVLDPSTGLVVPDSTILGGQRAYVLRPTKGLNDYSEIQEYVDNLAKQD